MAKALSPHARAALEAIAYKPQPAQGFNPGVVHKLLDEGLARETLGPAVNKRAKAGATIAYLAITREGTAARAQRSPELAAVLKGLSPPRR